VDFVGDAYLATWSRDEKTIVCMAYSYCSELWRLERQK
jgi:hypothetical protein